MDTPRPSPPRQRPQVTTQHLEIEAQLIGCAIVEARRYLRLRSVSSRRLKDAEDYIKTLVRGGRYEGPELPDTALEVIHYAFACVCLKLGIEEKDFPGQNRDWYEEQLEKAKEVQAQLKPTT